jgi:hypothetical protein
MKVDLVFLSKNSFIISDFSWCFSKLDWNFLFLSSFSLISENLVC